MNVTIFDVETTGSNTERDQIIEICIQQGLGASPPSKTWRCKPSIPIAPGAQKVHGISDADLKDCKPFSAYAKEIHGMLQSAEALVGYNINFDLSMVQAEFARAKMPLLDLDKIHLVDPYTLWRHFEPRDLSSAHKRFVGEPFEGAHAAQEDVRATGRVLEGMLDAFKIRDASLQKIAELCDVNAARKTWVGPSYHFRWEEETVVFGFGKHRARPILDVKKDDGGGYLSWLAAKDFPDHVKEIALAASKKSAEEFAVWIKATFKR